MKKINHCMNCEAVADCYDNNSLLYSEYDPCCPNMKPGRKQFKQFLEEYLREKEYIDKMYID